MSIRGIVLVVIGLGFFVLGYFITAGKQDLPQGQLQIQVAPSEAAVRIDDASAKTGTQNVDIGTHKVAITMPGFKSYEKTVNITQANETYVGLILSSNSPDTKDWFSNHEEDQKLTEAINDRLSDTQNAAIANKYPVFSILPATFGNGLGGLTRINPENPLNGSSKPSIGIYAANPQQRQAALDWIYNRNYDLSDIDVVLYGSDIPLKSEVPL